MRKLDEASRVAIGLVIHDHLDALEKIPGFLHAEPGFPIVDGRVLREPAVIAYVTHKRPPDSVPAEDLLPRQLGSYRVSVMQATPLMQVMHDGAFEDVASAVAAAGNELTYQGIEGNPIDNEFRVSAPFLCHVGPDSGWPVLRPFLEAAERSLSIAMYDFNADWILTAFTAAVKHNGIRIALTWDDGMTPEEQQIRQKLKQKLGALLDGGVVQCGGGRRFASAYHEKVAVRDSSAFWLSSGNWSKRSQPNLDPVGDPAQAKGMYSKGNREWHVIVDDGPLAAVFEQYIEHDLQGCKDEIAEGDTGAVLNAEARAAMPDVFVPFDWLIEQAAATLAVAEPVAPESLPTHESAVKVIPVLTPDNYLGRVTKLIRSAKRSLYLQYAYITYSDRPQDKDFTAFLDLLRDLSNKPGFDMRVIVGNNGAADKIRRLAETGWNDGVFRVQSNIHNKGIVVDGKAALISSANWSSDGVLRNRDAGLIIHDKEVAAYYEQVFLDDWESRAKSFISDDAPAIAAMPGEGTPPGMVRMSWRDYHG